MNTIAVSNQGSRIESTLNGQQLLSAMAKLWFAIAVIGQWLFGYYILSFYYTSALQGDLAAWNKILPNGYIAGDTLGNIALVVHVLLAAFMVLAGPLQLMPWLRAKLPVVHRWSGRFYIPLAIITSLSGLYMIWARDTAPLMQKLGISVNAILIVAFALLAVTAAIKGRLGAHRQWAIRLFIVVSGVWFFRVGLMLWLYLNDGPAGFDPVTFQGPFIVFMTLAQYLLPLAVLELYFYGQRAKSQLTPLLVAPVLLLMSIATAGGVLLATMGMWLPRI
jgi:uncharacterized membrane protein